MKQLLVYGSREFALVVRDLSGQCGHPFAGFVDELSGNAAVNGIPVTVAPAVPAPREQQAAPAAV